jgi:hypothetical protein
MDKAHPGTDDVASKRLASYGTKMTRSQKILSIQTYVKEDIAEWEQRHRILFERHELFMMKLCRELNIPYETSSENDVLEKIRFLNLTMENVV